MKTETLVDAIGKIDASYVEEAELWQKRDTGGVKRYLPRMLATAACLLLVAAGTFAALRSVNDNMSGGTKSDENGTGVQESEEISSEEDDLKSEESSSEGAEEGLPEGEAGQSGGGEHGEDDIDFSTAGNGSDTNSDEIPFQIPEDVAAVTVTRLGCGTEKTVTMEGAELDALRKWADELVLGEAVFFAEGTTPGEVSEGGQVYTFAKEDEAWEFSYRDFGDCYVVKGDAWYPVLNPTEPPGFQ